MSIASMLENMGAGKMQLCQLHLGLFRYDLQGDRKVINSGKGPKSDQKGPNQAQNGPESRLYAVHVD